MILGLVYPNKYSMDCVEEDAVKLESFHHISYLFREEYALKSIY